MSIQGKKIAMLKHACEVVQSVVNNASHNFKNPFLMELGLIRIKAQAGFTMRQIQSTPADRFNDDGSLKPEDMTGKVVAAPGEANPEKVRVLLEDVFKDSGFKVEGL